jgi:hypothetical protein
MHAQVIMIMADGQSVRSLPGIPPLVPRAQIKSRIGANGDKWRRHGPSRSAARPRPPRPRGLRARPYRPTRPAKRPRPRAGTFCYSAV